MDVGWLDLLGGCHGGGRQCGHETRWCGEADVAEVKWVGGGGPSGHNKIIPCYGDMEAASRCQVGQDETWRWTHRRGQCKQIDGDEMGGPAGVALKPALRIGLGVARTCAPCWKYAQEAIIKLFIIIFHVYDRYLLSML